MRNRSAAPAPPCTNWWRSPETCAVRASAAAAPWQDRIRIVTAKPLDASDAPGSRDASGVLVRPDGYVAWAATDGTEGLTTALTRWFGR
ncbi:MULTISPECIES: aromatic-ring hydroxylase C-terminal domain-containing protein [Nocardia]|uniref:aromatic-ring hydroxylase C-terminal domain-containing protein n=1 Tax=Nocardia TaxID=1817 RepID=UPI0035A23A7E